MNDVGAHVDADDVALLLQLLAMDAIVEVDGGPSFFLQRSELHHLLVIILFILPLVWFQMSFFLQRIGSIGLHVTCYGEHSFTDTESDSRGDDIITRRQALYSIQGFVE